jgi:hypothetical protein
MTTNVERKVIKAKVGLLELAKQLGNVTREQGGGKPGRRVF